MIRGFTCGTFDLTHAGHFESFRKAKKQCDWLLVGIKVDPTLDREGKNRPIQSILERELQVASCKWVDKVIVYETEKDLLTIMTSFDINKRFMGEEYFHNSSQVSYPLLVPITYLESISPTSSELRERIKGKQPKCDCGRQNSSALVKELYPDLVSCPKYI